MRDEGDWDQGAQWSGEVHSGGDLLIRKLWQGLLMDQRGRAGKRSQADSRGSRLACCPDSRRSTLAGDLQVGSEAWEAEVPGAHGSRE